MALSLFIKIVLKINSCLKMVNYGKIVLIRLLIIDNNKVEWRQNEESRWIKNRINGGYKFEIND